MKLRISQNVFILSIILSLASCKSDEEISPVNNCLPVNLRSLFRYTDSVVFEYSAARKPVKILDYKESKLFGVSIFEYDDAGRMTRYYVHNADVTAPPQLILEFHYGTNGKIDYRSHTFDPAVAPKRSLSYSYDAQGRLIKKRSEPNGGEWRFEYNSDNNIVRSFFKDEGSDVEVLGRENHTFDNSSPFYANSGELTTWAIYVQNFPPTRNNILTSSISKEAPNAHIHSVVNTTYAPVYDNRGLLKNYIDQSGAQSIFEFYFEDVNYECK